MTQTINSPPRRKRWLRRAIDVIVVLAVFFAVRTYQQRDAIEGPAPALRAIDVVDGGVVDLSQYRGKPVLLHFWATWCGVCKASQHNITAVAGDHAVVTVASQSGSTRDVQQYLALHPMGAPVVTDEHGWLSQRFGVRAFPTSFVIDAKGNIRQVEVGYSSELGLRLRLWLATL